ncbi:hypothetical protein GCM10022237_39600 [Nocardioides ginsengisoli]|uniref:Uncharacterized protein n=1 Tax=Kribbella ginsengisoli TaxID=363865 RepID=A0ABP6Z8J2_9ACTN
MSTATNKTLRVLRAQSAAYVVQLLIAASVVVVWSHADHYGNHPLSMTNRLCGGFGSAGLLLLVGRGLIDDAIQCRHARWQYRWGYVLVLLVCGLVTAKAGNYVSLGLPVVAVVMTGSTFGAVVFRQGEALLPEDPRGSWQPIHENAFRADWADLTRDRVESLIQDSSDQRLTLWSLPPDITGSDPLPFTAVLGPLDEPFGFYRFVLATARQEAGR